MKSFEEVLQEHFAKQDPEKDYYPQWVIDLLKEFYNAGAFQKGTY